MMKEPSPDEMFDMYVGYVKGGRLSYEGEARTLAAQHGFPLRALEDALFEIRRKAKRK